jgi:hypothetical protein
VLAVVDDFAGTGMLIRRSAAAKISPAFEQSHAKAAARKGATSGEPRQSTSHHGHSGIW